MVSAKQKWVLETTLQTSKEIKEDSLFLNRVYDVPLHTHQQLRIERTDSWGVGMEYREGECIVWKEVMIVGEGGRYTFR